MTKFILEINLDDETSCAGCPIINDCFMSLSGHRQDDCPLTLVEEHSCKTCKHQNKQGNIHPCKDCVYQGYLTNDHWEKKE